MLFLLYIYRESKHKAGSVIFSNPSEKHLCGPVCLYGQQGRHGQISMWSPGGAHLLEALVSCLLRAGVTMHPMQRYFPSRLEYLLLHCEV